jgi:hypothetical protein
MTNPNSLPLNMKTSFVHVIEGTAHGIPIEVICSLVRDTKLVAPAPPLTDSSCSGPENSKKVPLSSLSNTSDGDFRQLDVAVLPDRKGRRLPEDLLQHSDDLARENGASRTLKGRAEPQQRHEILHLDREVEGYVSRRPPAKAREVDEQLRGEFGGRISGRSARHSETKARKSRM